MFEYWIDILTTIIEAPVIGYFAAKAIKTKKVTMCVLVYSIVFTIVNILLSSKREIQWIVMLAATLAVLLYFSEVKKVFTIFYYIIGIALMLLFETAIELIIYSFYPEYGIIYENFKLVVITRVIIEPILIVVWYLNNKICNKLFKLGNSREFDRYMPFIVVESIALYMVYITQISIDLGVQFYVEVLLGLLFVAFIIIDLLLIHTFRKLDIAHEKEVGERTSKEILQVQMETYQFQYEKTREFRKIRHDLVNQLQTLQLFLESNEIDKAKLIISNYSEEMKSSGRISITGNEFADLVIGKKQEKIKKENIEFNVFGTIPNDLKINPVVLCSLLENILDNAINGCLSSLKTEKIINLYVSSDINKIIIKCANTCSDDSKAPIGKYRENGDHGWGTQIIDSIAARYGGAVEYQVDNGCFTVNLYCFMNLGQEDIVNG